MAKRQPKSFVGEVDALSAPDRSLILSDCREALPRIPVGSVALTHTSPPYNIGRNYRGFRDRQDMDEYQDLVRAVFGELHRVTRPGGSVFWQVGYTTYGNGGESTPGGIMALDCLSLPLALDAGFVLWDRIIWSYLGSMAFQSKFTNRYETILWLTKTDASITAPSFALDEVRERSKQYDGRNHLLGKNPGNVWHAERVAFGSIGQTSHVAVFPEEVSEKIVRACSQPNDLVLDPFSGSGTLPKVAFTLGRRFVGTEISEQYLDEADQRLRLWRSSEAENLAIGLLVKYGFHSRAGKEPRSRLAKQLGGFLKRKECQAEIRRLRGQIEEITDAPRVTRALKDRKTQLWEYYDKVVEAGDESKEIIAADRALGFCFAHRHRWNGLRRYLTAAEGLLALQDAIDAAPSVDRYMDDLCEGADTRFKVLSRDIECLRPDPGLGCNGETRPSKARRQEKRDQMPLWA